MAGQIFFRLIRFYLLFILLAFGLGCAKVDPIESSNYSCSNRASSTYTGTLERSICTTVQTHTGGVTITGAARFQKRAYGGSGLSSTLTATAIRYAEIVVTDSSGSVVQCGNTDASGNYSLALPNSTAIHTLRINSRGFNSTINASVLNCPEENSPYYIEASFQPDSSKALSTITATSTNTGDMNGAAFNIFDQFVTANLFLQTQLGACSTPEPGCTNFVVPPKLQAYWVKGFTPNAYFGSSSPLSFYLPSYSRLYILGGVNGDIYTSDTDHFDDSVILHEYGHFLEDIYTVTNSPGGSHSGNSLVDPRLAWGEGWGNFIQGAIRNDGYYKDTLGTPNTSSPASTSSYIFNIPLEEPNVGCTPSSTTSGCDVPEFPGEGVFREFSVARLLWDVFDGTGESGTDAVNNEMIDLWATLTKTVGFKNTNFEFRNAGTLHFVQQNRLTASSDWSTIRTAHKHPSDTTEYAQYVTATDACGKVYSFSPYDDTNDNGSFSTSHRLRNNNFHHFYNPTTQTITLVMKALTTNPAGQEPDIDLYLYNENARYGNSSDMVKVADNYWDNNAATQQTETLTVTNLPAGHYLINTKIFTGTISVNQCFGSNPATDICQNDSVPAGDATTYELEINGVNLCPNDVP